MKLAQRGVEVQVLTNSLESNDVVAVHAGYAKRRKKLLHGGVKLYELKATPLRKAHTRFGYMWNWDGGEHVIMSRTTDDIGVVQPTREQVAKALGVAYTPNFRPPGTNNTIMPWKIASDGSVTNGLA